jgi:hypothetical protein
VKTSFIILLVLGILSCSALGDFVGAYELPTTTLIFSGDRPSPNPLPVGTWNFSDTGSGAGFGSTTLGVSSTSVIMDTGFSTQMDAESTLQLLHPIVSSGTLAFDYQIAFLKSNDPITGDEAGYTLNGVLTLLPQGLGTVTLPVTEGDVFGFYADAPNSCLNCEVTRSSNVRLTVTNFSAPVPEPASTFLLAFGLVMIPVAACRYVRRKDLTRRSS